MGVTGGRSASEPDFRRVRTGEERRSVPFRKADDGATTSPPQGDVRGEGIARRTECTHPTRQRHTAGSPLKPRQRRGGESGASSGRSKRAPDVAIGP